MEQLEATYRIVTPMFIGGAEQSPDDGIRPSSIKGALRFWWRALNWGLFRTGSADDASALKALHEEEKRLFGLAAKTVKGKQVGGQGAFLLTVRHDELTSKQPLAVHNELKTKAAACYLGYGLIVAYGNQNQVPPTQSGQLIRGCIDEGKLFTVTLTFRDKIDGSVLNALKALGLLGGLGSRSRHGMGSVALEKIVSDEKEIWTAPTTQEDYVTKVKNLMMPLATVPEPDYSAFSKESRVDILLLENTPYEVLNQFGMKMLDYRSWGQTIVDGVRRRLPSGKTSEERFKDDHDWFRVRGWVRPNFHPMRVVFGLPHNYHRNHHHVISETHERRSSPLLFHVHPLLDKFVGVGIYLRARFLPNNEKILANNVPVAPIYTWSVITDFLDGKVGNPPTTEDRFPTPNKQAVLP